MLISLTLSLSVIQSLLLPPSPQNPHLSTQSSWYANVRGILKIYSHSIYFGISVHAPPFTGPLMSTATSLRKGKWMWAHLAWMRENAIDFQWGHSAKFNAQAHKRDQVLMNINVDLMKNKEQSNGRKSQTSQGPVFWVWIYVFKH